MGAVGPSASTRGDWRSAHRLACAEFSHVAHAPVDEKRAVVVASCGGAPYDINVIQAHNALHGDLRLPRGRAIVLVAECAKFWARGFPQVVRLG